MRDSSSRTAEAGGVVIARFDRAQTLVDGLRHALDLERDRFDRLRLAAFGGGEAAVDVGERAFEAFAADAVERGLQLAGEFVRASPTICETDCAMVSSRCSSMARTASVSCTRAALLDARAERGDGLLQRADGGVGGGLGFGDALGQPLQRLVQRLHRAVDMVELVVRRVSTPARRRFERRQRIGHGAGVGLGLERGEAFGDVLLRLTQFGEIDARRLRRRCPRPASRAPPA